MNPSLVVLRPPTPCVGTAASLIIGSTLHLAKARGFGQPKPDPTPEQREKKLKKAMRGKPMPCPDCPGNGLKPCNFCKGTKKMKGFYDILVPCVPCEATGTTGIKCKTCNGVGYLMN